LRSDKKLGPELVPAHLLSGAKVRDRARQKANHEIPDRVTPLGQVREALEYYCAGIVTEQQLRVSTYVGDIAISPAYFLLGHSIELSLKSLLRMHGISPEVYRKPPLGHDLVNCLREVELRTPSLSRALGAADRYVLSLLNAKYSNKGFEYFGNGAVELPMFGPTCQLSRTILNVSLQEVPLAQGHLRGRLREIFESAP
jgi:hypothetical protein